MPSSILKPPKPVVPIRPRRGTVDSASPSPPPRLTRSVKDCLAEEDAKIEALERALGIVGKKQLPKSFRDDGLDSLLEGLDESQSGGEPLPVKRNGTQGDRTLKDKGRDSFRGKFANNSPNDKSQSLTRDPFSNDDTGADESDESDGMSGEDDASSEASFEGFDMDHSVASPAARRVRENPYIAPSMHQNTQTMTKYVPPSQRVLDASDEEALQRLRRQIQGLLNRLSEANVIAILSDFERLYRDHPRQHISSTLQDLLLNLLCDPTSLQDTFIVLHAGFIAGVYKLIGSDFGAHIVQKIVEDFDALYTSTEDNGKKLANLTCVLAELYNFQVLSSGLIYDFVRMFLNDFSENNTELLLKIVRSRSKDILSKT